MEWKQIWIGQDSYVFLLEVIIRTLIMFVLLLITLRLTGKRGVKQLSIFEMVMIIALGSAAGDPMFYKDVGILPALLVFVFVLLSYRIVVYFITSSEKMEFLLEGKPIYIIKEGESTAESVSNQELASDEFFAELRGKGIDHFGQIKCAVLETNGEISILFFKDEDVRPGLPIWPELFDKKLTSIIEEGIYSCTHCGKTERTEPVISKTCSKCKNNKWVKALSCTRTV